LGVKVKKCRGKVFLNLRILVIADIHSNLEALKTVLEEAPEYDSVVCVGDVVGYGPNPNECVDEVRALNAECVMGNHDYASVTDVAAGFNPYAAYAVHYTHRKLTEESLKYLSGLPRSVRLEVEGVRVAVYHGSPRAPLDEYVFPDYPSSTLSRFLQMADADLLILGHTHVPMVRRVERGVVVNPGSVGQPRDGDPRASFMVLDLSGGEVDVRHFRVKYDVERVARVMRDEGLPPMLYERLFLGW